MSYFTAAGVKCPVPLHSAAYSFISFGIIEIIHFFENRMPLEPVLAWERRDGGGVEVGGDYAAS